MTPETCKAMDFRNSYIINSSAIDGQPCNTCRTQAIAACTLIDQTSGHEQTYYLGQACIGEHMYLDGDISQQPTAEVCITFGADRYKLQKKFADYRHDVVQIANPDEEVVLFDGRTATWTDLRFEIRKGNAVELDSVDAMIIATEGLKPLVAKTIITGAAGTNDAVLEYPIPYMNFKPDHKAVQIDVGPILYGGVAGEVASDIAGIELAYIMYRDLDHAEFAVRGPVSIGEPDNTKTLHYAKVIHTRAMTKIYALQS